MGDAPGGRIRCPNPRRGVCELPSVVYHLIGRPGVGKYTIGVELSRLTGARLVDNHSVANVIFNLINPDGVTPLPHGVWSRVGQVRAAVIDTLINLAPRELSFVFTNFIRGEDAAEYAAFMELVDAAAARGSVFVPIVLSCDTGELVQRIVRPERRARMKLVDPVEGARLN
ncbi:MAG: hypothetical protein ACRDG3_11655, partial [Tepidiformaceae bacterium]